MKIYIESLSLLNFVFKILPKLWSYNKNKRTEIMYFEATGMIKAARPLLSYLFYCHILEIQFEMRDIRDENGELLKLRIQRQDSFDIQSGIMNSEIYKSIFRQEWEEDTISKYLEKGLTPMNIINDPNSVARIVFMIQVVSWHMKKSEVSSSVFFIQIRPWMSIYCDYARILGITLLGSYQLPDLKQSFRTFAYQHPWILHYLKKFRYLDFSWGSIQLPVPSKSNLYVHGRGAMNFKNNGLNSDIFFSLQSKFPTEQILFQLNSPVSKDFLNNHHHTKLGFISSPYMGRNPSTLPAFSNKFRLKKAYPLSRKNIVSFSEEKILRGLIANYNYSLNYWNQIISLSKIKIYLTWNRYTNDHLPIYESIRNQGGVLAMWQSSYETHPSPWLTVVTDVFFGTSTWTTKNECVQDSKIPYYVATGYLNDHCAPLLVSKANDTRKYLKKNGATKIIACFDENSCDDSRWSFGHEGQRENYTYLLNFLFENPEIGVIFKPKTPKTLRNRLGGDVCRLLDDALNTGRCYIFDDSGTVQSNVPPVLAGLASDIAIHSHLHAGTCAVECALAGIPTLLVDREQCRDSQFYQLGEGNVVFQDWPMLLDALMMHWKEPGSIPHFGDWSPLLDQLDPFRDGRAAERMGTYLHWMIQGLEQGVSRDTVLADAAECYGKKWGYDKILSVGI
jgi:hypothetical protein